MLKADGYLILRVTTTES